MSKSLFLRRFNKTDFSVVYYTDNNLPHNLERFFQDKLIKSLGGEDKIVSVSHWPLKFGKNTWIGASPRRERTMWEQILIGLRNAKSYWIYLCEHDVLYSPSHFCAHYHISDHKNVVGAFNMNLYRMNNHGFIFNVVPLLSMLCCKRKTMMKIVENNLFANYLPRLEREVGKIFHYVYSSEPCVDVRHGYNATGNRDYHNRVSVIDYWGDHGSLWQSMGLSLETPKERGKIWK